MREGGRKQSVENTFEVVCKSERSVLVSTGHARHCKSQAADINENLVLYPPHHVARIPFSILNPRKKAIPCCFFTSDDRRHHGKHCFFLSPCCSTRRYTS